jgi:GNAT superfamily N-acetyltransferase
MGIAEKPPGGEPWSLRHEVAPADRAHVRSIVESTGFFHAAEVEIAVELVDERLAKGETSGYYFVFADPLPGPPLGYACYGRIPLTESSYDLYWIAVRQDHHGRGLGRALLEEVERRVAAAGGRRIYIETSNRPQYQPTRGFYLRSGYEQAALLKDFYAAGDDKVIYVRAL